MAELGSLYSSEVSVFTNLFTFYPSLVSSILTHWQNQILPCVISSCQFTSCVYNDCDDSAVLRDALYRCYVGKRYLVVLRKLTCTPASQEVFISKSAVPRKTCSTPWFVDDSPSRVEICPVRHCPWSWMCLFIKVHCSLNTYIPSTSKSCKNHGWQNIVKYSLLSQFGFMIEIWLWGLGRESVLCPIPLIKKSIFRGEREGE